MFGGVIFLLPKLENDIISTLDLCHRHPYLWEKSGQRIFKNATLLTETT